MEHEQIGQDPIYSAICLGWPRQILICMADKQRVAERLSAPDCVGVAHRWSNALERVERAALAGAELPSAGNTLLRIFSKVTKEAV